jgi:cAMP-specific phosphodiesterase 4
VNARTDLALLYNDASVLENHHCSTSFFILRKAQCNILANMSHDDQVGLITHVASVNLQSRMSLPSIFNHACRFRQSSITHVASVNL